MKRAMWAAVIMATVGLSLQPATAADVPARMPSKAVPSLAPIVPWNWSGFYVGVNGGYGWGRSTWDGLDGFNVQGWLVGGTVGFNYQVGMFVAGIEGDIDWSNMKGDTACAAARCETKSEWFGTGRGRLGYAVDRFMPFVTGGVAFGNVKATNTNVGFTSASQNRIGWTVGGGIEYAAWRNLTLKAEYLYVDLGKFDCGASCSAAPPVNVSFTANIVRAGINYKF